MSKDIPFNPELQCDNCDEVGAYDFMGDYLCPNCIDFHIDEISDDFGDVKDDYDLWDFVA